MKTRHRSFDLLTASGGDGAAAGESSPAFPRVVTHTLYNCRGSGITKDAVGSR